MVMEITVQYFELIARSFTQIVALAIDIIALSVIALAAARSIYFYLSVSRHHKLSQSTIGQIRLDLGQGLVLGLEFSIGADILRTAIAPTWTSIGQLGAIILLRTLLDYFLERELREIEPEKPTA